MLTDMDLLSVGLVMQVHYPPLKWAVVTRVLMAPPHENNAPASTFSLPMDHILSLLIASFDAQIFLVVNSNLFVVCAFDVVFKKAWRNCIKIYNLGILESKVFLAHVGNPTRNVCVVHGAACPRVG